MCLVQMNKFTNTFNLDGEHCTPEKHLYVTIVSVTKLVRSLQHLTKTTLHIRYLEIFADICIFITFRYCQIYFTRLGTA